MKKQPNRWFTFSSLAFQIGGIMYGTIRLGQYFDNYYGHKGNLFSLALSVFGLVAVIWLIVKQTKRF
ncbi:MAG: hypothetical protein ACI9TK_000058 [Flavobacteriaceae bacterium]